jgi:hypothetical protein
MPLFEYEYTDEHGQLQVVEELYKSVEVAPDTITVSDGDAIYTAKRKAMSLPGSAAHNWSRGRADADLPPVNAPPSVWDNHKPR